MALDGKMIQVSREWTALFLALLLTAATAVDVGAGTVERGLYMADNACTSPGQYVFEVHVVDAPNDLGAFMFEVRFDTAVLAFDGGEEGPLISGFVSDHHEIVPGLIRVGGYSLSDKMPAGCSGVLYRLVFTADRCVCSRLELINLKDSVAGWDVHDAVLKVDPVIGHFTAVPECIEPGGSSTLSWAVEGAQGVSITPDPGSVDPSGGSLRVSPSRPTTYTLRALNVCGETTAAVKVRVGQDACAVPALSKWSAMIAAVLLGGVCLRFLNRRKAGEILK